MDAFNGRITLITGGASGIGRLLSLKISARGSHVVIWDVDEEGLSRVTGEIAAAGYQATYYRCDVSDRSMVYAMADRVRQEVGDIDILINNAGVVGGKPFLETDDLQIKRTMEVNALAHFWTVKAFLPRMIKAGRGHIVTIASAGGVVGTPGLVDYSASKFAAFGFDEALRGELKKAGLNIRTTVVCPFFIRGEMFAGVRTRLPILLPILDPDRVAERIVTAVARKRQRVIMPSLVKLTWLLRLLPMELFDRANMFLGVYDAMDSFKGRKGGPEDDDPVR
jgi:all-trans-retinol dehydrogenase (NAD+)